MPQIFLKMKSLQLFKPVSIYACIRIYRYTTCVFNLNPKGPASLHVRALLTKASSSSASATSFGGRANYMRDPTCFKPVARDYGLPSVSYALL